MNARARENAVSRTDAILGVMPGLAYALSQAWWYLWPPDSLIAEWGIRGLAVLVVIVYVELGVRARRVADWLIMGSGMLLALLISTVFSAIARPAGIAPAIRTGAVVSALNALTVVLAPVLLAVWGGALAAQRRGAISLLPLASFVFLMQQSIIDPTYAWLIWLPPSTRLLAALTVLAVMAPTVIGMPLLTARAATPRGGYAALLGMGLLSAELATLSGLVRIVAMQGQATNAPGIAQSLGWMLTAGQGLAIAPALALAVVAVIYTRLENRQPPARSTPLIASS